ncbi:MAG: type II toxin-antitoxin system RelE/ParE family toxin [Planctomycetes bacterium]|jgi:plasmid stabilization system protein ParE|nr:type II toxin-antitoxin system RelE/ParE family toxin [Planctomycetota bacterium]
MTILWTEPSLDDLQAIRDYIARDSETYAGDFVGSILSAVDRLSTFPRLGRVVPEADRPDIRELIWRGYRIIYRADQDVVQILAIIHGCRDVSQMSAKPWEVD